MRKLIFVVSVTLTCVMVCGQLDAQGTIPDGKDLGPRKWSQLPDLDNGQDLMSSVRVDVGLGGVPIYPTTPFVVVADDWRCLDGLPVTDFHWWGAYITGGPDLMHGFQISIHADIPADNIHGSHPGEMLWTTTARMTDVEEEFFGMNQVSEVIQYNYVLPHPDNYFLQEQGEIYWLSILALTVDCGTNPDGLPTVWGWHTAMRPAPENGLDAAVVLYNYQPETGDYAAWGLLSDETCNLQMAFEITTIPEPTSATLLLGGAAAVALRRRLRKRRR